MCVSYAYIPLIILRDDAGRGTRPTYQDTTDVRPSCLDNFLISNLIDDSIKVMYSCRCFGSLDHQLPSLWKGHGIVH